MLLDCFLFQRKTEFRVSYEILLLPWYFLNKLTTKGSCLLEQANTLSLFFEFLYRNTFLLEQYEYWF